MRVRANRELAEELFARLSAGDVAGTLAMLADDATWLSQLSSGRQDFPLLFDLNHQPKKAFRAVVGF